LTIDFGADEVPGIPGILPEETNGPGISLPVDDSPIKVRYNLIPVDYCRAWQAMKEFTDTRTGDTPDEIWLLQHSPVYTQGVAGKPEHLLHENGIPVVRTDRGGQITYHGPGQIIGYLMLDMRRLGLGVRELVSRMEGAVIDLLSEYRINSEGCREAPGVYVDGAKIASLGLKIKKGCCYHGLAFNVDMDLKPFSAINPCGYAGLRVTQLKDFGVTDGLEILSSKLARKLRMRLLPA
jgi:lipoyl(octanoyl) transferase